jgi:hypothetical protein
LYVVVEFDPETGLNHVLFPRFSMAQVHETLDSAEEHRNWYVNAVYQEDPGAGDRLVRIYRLEPVRV